ncbi:UNC-like C-terminal-domain-containing protein [Russula vinacea]|nr:UNC-like C-terminal-domain-containing protein [Russula vinacea]
MLSPCGAWAQFVVVELCEDIRIDTVQLANFEFFSGVFREFTVSVAKTHAAADAEGWTVVGTYEGKNVRGVQSFHPPTSVRDFYRYIRIDFHSHYSNEYYCPISLLRVYGLTHLEQWKWDIWEEESRARLDLNAQTTAAHADIPHEPERPADSPWQAQEDPTTSHDSSSPATSPHDSTTESSQPFESSEGQSTDIAQLELSTLSGPDSPIISTPSASPSTPDSEQAINNFTQQSHMSMSNDSTIASTTTSLSSSVSISSRPTNVSGINGSASRSSSQTIATPIPSPSIVIPASASHPPPPPQVNLPLASPPANAHTGESIYRTIMNRLSALEANTTLYARYVEEQTNAMREMLRRLNEDVGRLEASAGRRLRCMPDRSAISRSIVEKWTLSSVR